jgi:hypothetical protein
VTGRFDFLPAKFEFIHIDYCGPFPPSKHGNLYVLTMIDRATSLVELAATPDSKAETTAVALWKKWITRYGCPHYLFRDNGPQFVGEVIKTLGARFKITLRAAAAYTPHMNGKVERVHRTLKSHLQIYCEAAADWEDALDGFVFAARNNVNAGMKYTSAFLTYGRELRYPGELVMGDVVYGDQEDEISEMLGSLDTAQRVLELERLRKVNKQDANGELRPADVKVGDMVYAKLHRLPPGSARKMVKQYTGLWEVIEKSKNGAICTIQKDGVKRTGVHSRHLRMAEGKTQEPLRPREYLGEGVVLREDIPSLMPTSAVEVMDGKKLEAEISKTAVKAGARPSPGKARSRDHG